MTPETVRELRKTPIPEAVDALGMLGTTCPVLQIAKVWGYDYGHVLTLVDYYANNGFSKIPRAQIDAAIVASRQWAHLPLVLCRLLGANLSRARAMAPVLRSV